MNKVYDVIINSKSSDNIDSKFLVKALKIPTKIDPSSYKIDWIKKGAKTKVIGP